MNKVITINLNGVAYQLEEGGYDALQTYLDAAARRLEGNPDKEEIVADIEQAIADKFRAVLGAHKTVINTKEVAAVLTEMGPVEDDAGTAAAQEAKEEGASPGASSGRATGAGSSGVRKLYRIYPEGAMLSGVCNGLGAYFGLDPTLFRLGFVLLAFLWGAGFWIYIVMVFLIPRAKTPVEKAAATGVAATAQEFIRRAREGYYEGMKAFRDKHAHREWKRKFKRDMRAWKYGFHQHVHEQAWRAGQNWQGQWGPRPTGIVGPVFVAPLLSLFLFGLVCVMIYSCYTVVKYHAVFGFALPAAMPVWAGILLVIFGYVVVAWPVKAMRWACYYPVPCRNWDGPFGGLPGSLIGLFFLAFGIWMMDRHVPGFHEWLVQLPALLQRLTDTVSAWFATKP